MADQVLRYTLDGTDPTTNSAVYTEPFTIDETTTIKARAFSETFFDSQIVTTNLTREWIKIASPTAVVSVASSGLSVLVDLGCVDTEAELHYTLDGSEPTAESPIYTQPFYAFDASVVKVVAIKDDFAASNVLTQDIAIYCVIDLADGTCAASYPVTYIVGVPSGGWSDEYKTTKLVLRKINAGTFIMGEDQTNEAHRVTLTKPFYMGVFEVTQKQWSLVMGSNPSKDYGVGDTYPVYHVSYDMIRGTEKGAQWPVSSEVDATSFLGILQARTGITIDLPTEAQWEYACRAGTTTAYYWGDTMDGGYAWYKDNAGSLTHPVGSKKPNAWGLYDMSGNAWNWCLNWYGALSYGDDPISSTGDVRVIRGAGSLSTAKEGASYYRGQLLPSGSYGDAGLRVVLPPQYPQSPVISPESGTTFNTPSLSISMACDSAYATIHYTTNGLTPTMASPVYKKFRISGKTTVKAIAFYEDGTPSEMAGAEYALGACADPIISPKDGTVFQHSHQAVSITCGAEGILRYTLDGTEPTADSPICEGPFTINESTVVKAKMFSDSFFDSQVVTANLTREWVTVGTPVISAGVTFTGTREVVTITCGTDGAEIHYTLDGSEPTKGSPLYRGSFNVKESCIIKAIALKDDYIDSEVTTVSVMRVRGIGDVLGVPDVVFTCNGAADWTEDIETVGAVRDTSMKSGKITHLQESTLSATVTGKGLFSFYVKTSCEDSDGYFDWDRLEFTADGDMLPLDGERGWTNIVWAFTTDGPHTLTWTYVKDDAGGEGNDCAWLSNVTWMRTDVDPLPEIETDGTPAQVDGALEDAVDARLRARIVVGCEYMSFRNWSNRVGGDEFAHHQAVKNSPHAWLSYALDSDKLLTKAPEQGEMRIAAFEKNATTGSFDFLVTIDGVTVGTNATAENLATLLGIEGSSAVDGTYSAENLTYVFGTPVDGKITVSAAPIDVDANQFFIRAKMTP